MNSGRANISVLSDCLKSIAVLRTSLHMYNKDIADVSQVPLFMLKDSEALLLYIANTYLQEKQARYAFHVSVCSGGG